jgi:hypothetical protein
MGFVRSYISAVLAVFGLVSCSGILFAACSTNDTRLSTVPESAGKNARAHPAAYGVVDTFMLSKPHKIRPANEFQFYFKDCEMTDPANDRAFFSKTAYSCSGVR